MSNVDVLADLQARGLVQDCTDADGLTSRLAEGPITLYFGCDPTASSLHVGNLLGLLVLRRFQQAGHRPIALAGGATGMVGDPSGRSEERNLLDDETLSANVAGIKEQIARVVGADVDLVDNRDWTADVRLLDFLRDVGKFVTVNTMLGRESVRNRLASEHGISYTEFSYMLLQAHDYLLLERDRGCQLQIGGSDQWGNMVGGVDLIRRVSGRPAWALCWPLLTAPDGTKLGKTTGARIWLDPERTSPYQFFQHWMQTDDRQVRQFLAQFTLMALDEIDEVLAEHESDPAQRVAQRRLAHEVTTLVHGPEQAEAAAEASQILFGAPVRGASIEALTAVAAEVPVMTVTRAEIDTGMDVSDLLSGVGLAASKGEARRALTQGGVYVNGERVEQGSVVTDSDLLYDRYVVLRKGKRTFGLVDVA